MLSAMSAPHLHTRPHFPPAFSADGARPVDMDHAELLLGANADACEECESAYILAVLNDPPEVLAHIVAMAHVSLEMMTAAIGGRLGVSAETARQALTKATSLSPDTRKAFSALQSDPAELERVIAELDREGRSAVLQDVLNTLSAMAMAARA